MKRKIAVSKKVNGEMTQVQQPITLRTFSSGVVLTETTRFEFFNKNETDAKYRNYDDPRNPMTAGQGRILGLYFTLHGADHVQPDWRDESVRDAIEELRHTAEFTLRHGSDIYHNDKLAHVLTPPPIVLDEAATGSADATAYQGHHLIQPVEASPFGGRLYIASFEASPIPVSSGEKVEVVVDASRVAVAAALVNHLLYAHLVCEDWDQSA